MRISTKGRYSLRAMIDVAFYGKKRPVRLKELSERTEISRNYLVQLFQQLKKAKLVKSIRGPTGGFVLMKPAKSITVKDILVAVNESFVPVACLEENSRRKVCARAPTCTARAFWRELKKQVEGYFANVTLDELYQREKEMYYKDVPQNNIDFSI
ncbi:MAG: Rrf2 family transcriptional regulator [Myxococcota bacterium]